MSQALLARRKRDPLKYFREEGVPCKDAYNALGNPRMRTRGESDLMGTEAGI